MSTSENTLKDLIQSFYNSSLKVKLSALFLIAMYILPAISNLTIVAVFAANIDDIKYWDTSTLVYLSILLFFTSSFSITSTTLLSIAAGYLFGWISFPILLIMFSIGSLLGYFLASKFDQGTIMGWIQKNEVTYNFIEKLSKRMNLMVFIMRLTPVLPFTVTNILCSYLSVPFRNYFFMGIVGIGTRLIATVYTGTQIKSIVDIDDDPTYKFQRIGFLIISLVLFGILYYLVMREKDKVTNA
jgi:uncharacterized membrane protein YdjX (TVP38/TMEM64 family)